MERGFYSVDDQGNEKQLEDHIIISITDPDSQPAKITTYESCKGILRLTFWDIIDTERLKNDPEAQLKYAKIFTVEDAKQIGAFVKRHMDKKLILVHCEAGISRSAGVAAALSKFINNDDEYYFKRYHPNKTIYNILLKELFDDRCSKTSLPTS